MGIKTNFHFFPRGAVRLLVDTGLCALAFLAAVRPVNVELTGRLILLYAVISGAVLYGVRVHRMMWRYLSFNELLALLKATAIVAVIFGAFYFAIWGMSVVAFIWISFVWIFTLGFLVVPRLALRWATETRRSRTNRSREPNGQGPMPILLTGTPERMEIFLREVARATDPGYSVVGVLSSNAALTGGSLHGVKVLGKLTEFVSILKQLEARGSRPRRLVLANDDASKDEVDKLLDLTKDTGVMVARVPRLASLQAEGQLAIRPIALCDLLGRLEVRVNIATIASMIEGRRILITGAGGSIGSELSRQVAALAPAELILADASEFNLYTIDLALASSHADLQRRSLLLDVRDRSRVSEIIAKVRPAVVFHAAALKHVPLLESNAIEAIKTNVLGTMNVADACRANTVETMIVISTDKAVNPSNVMGATKRLAESYCQGLDQGLHDGKAATRFVTVRFGNVLGSAGSVVPLFQSQIEAGGPVTVTHPEITRFFMTIPEAVTLVLQAGAQAGASPDERGSIYVLDMGNPVKILDLARQMIRLSGKTSVEITFVGLRPGEKLFEEVVHSDEVVQHTHTSNIFRATPRCTDIRILHQQLQELLAATASGDEERALRLLGLAVPEYVAEIRQRSGAATHLA